MSVDKTGKIANLHTITDKRGSLSVVEEFKEVPFKIKRCFWMYGVPEGYGRGGHAHKTLKQFVIAVSGSFRVTLDDSNVKESFFLDSPGKGLLIDACVWAELENFSPDAVCLVLASDIFVEADYLGTYREFLDYLASRNRQI